MNLPRLTYLAIAVGAAVWCLLVTLPPLLITSSPSFNGAAELVYSFFRPVCHQLDQRSITVFGEPLAVCSRCSAVYFGFLLGTLLYPLFRSVRHPAMPPRWVLVVALTPMVLDVATGLLGVHATDMTTRLITGGVFGVIIPFVILPVAIEGVGQLFSRSTVHQQKGFSDA